MKKLFISIGLIINLFLCYSETIGKKLDKTIDYTKNLLKQMKYGLKGGINSSKITNLKKTSSGNSFDIGIYGKYDMGKYISIQPEILLSSQKFENSSPKETVLNNYLSFPFIVQYHLKKTFSFEIGYQLNLAITKDNYHCFNSRVMKANGVDFSLLLGFKYNIGQYIKIFPELDITGRYFIGLNNIYKLDKDSSNKNLGFQVGLSFPF